MEGMTLLKKNKVNDFICNIMEGFCEDTKKVMNENLNRIVLYGSYARGDFRMDSDIDIMVFTDLDEDELIDYEKKLFDLSFDYQLDYQVDISVILKNTNQFDKWVNVLPFYRNVREEGIILYGNGFN